MSSSARTSRTSSNLLGKEKRLYPYQKDGVNFLGSRSGALLCDEAGLGKTAQAISACVACSAKKILVIAPKNLKPWWIRSIEEWDSRGTLEQRDSVPVYVTRSGRAWWLAHYEQFANNGTFTHDREVWDIIVCDEVHKIKNRKAQRTRRIKHLRSVRRWGLTASPVADKPADLWSLLNWVAPQKFVSFWGFVTTFTHVTIGPFGNRVLGEPRYLDVLAERVKPYLLARTLEQVGHQLPPLVMKDVWLELGVEQGRLYRDIKRQFLVELGDEKTLIIPSILARFTRLHQVASCPSVFGLRDNTKLEWFEDYLESDGTPAVIMTRYLETVDQVKKCLGSRDGFLVGTYSSLAEGHNFQDRWSRLILWDMCYSRHMYEQAIWRVHRPGQKRPVTVIRLLADGTVDDNVRQAVERKMKEAEMVLDYIRQLKGEIGNGMV